VLDVGCGSGVLAIAAGKLGFAPVTAVDADEHAVEGARRNADANDVSITVRRADALTDELPEADVAIVNVTHEVVEGAASQQRWPRLVASGYLVSEPPALEGYRHVERAAEDGWAADLFTR
jgi:ribosomal protein L11 methyltransferase